MPLPMVGDDPRIAGAIACATRPADATVHLDPIARGLGPDRIAPARERRIGLGGAGPGRPVIAAGNAGFLSERPGKLIDAGLGSRPARSESTRSAGAAAGMAVPAVTDSGPGILVPLRDSVFERRPRGRPARGPGAGRSLFMVRAFARASSDCSVPGPRWSGQRTRVEVRFPPDDGNAPHA